LRHSFLGTLFLGFNFAVLGITLVEKRMSLVGDTLSHAILPGVVLGALIGGGHPLYLLGGGWVAGLLIYFLTQRLSRQSASHQEATFAFVAVFFVAIGMILSFKTQKSSDVLHWLLGNLLAFDLPLLLTTLLVSIITWGLFFVGRHIWSLWILDAEFVAPASKLISVLKLLGPFLLMTNLILSLYSLGAMMTVGLLVIPALTAQLLFLRLYHRVAVAALLNGIYVYVGFQVSLLEDWPLGPSLVVAAGLGHLLALALRPQAFRSWRTR